MMAGERGPTAFFILVDSARPLRRLGSSHNHRPLCGPIADIANVANKSIFVPEERTKSCSVQIQLVFGGNPSMVHNLSHIFTHFCSIVKPLTGFATIRRLHVAVVIAHSINLDLFGRVLISFRSPFS